MGISLFPTAEALVEGCEGMIIAVILRAGKAEIIADWFVGETVSLPGSTVAVNANPEIRTVVIVSEGRTFASPIGNYVVTWDIALLSRAVIRSYT